MSTTKPSLRLATLTVNPSCHPSTLTTKLNAPMISTRVNDRKTNAIATTTIAHHHLHPCVWERRKGGEFCLRERKKRGALCPFMFWRIFYKKIGHKTFWVLLRCALETYINKLFLKFFYEKIKKKLINCFNSFFNFSKKNITKIDDQTQTFFQTFTLLVNQKYSIWWTLWWNKYPKNLTIFYNETNKA